MIIETLKLKNYRQYVDEEISFAIPEGNKNFTIIQGVNGAGKTNILNAITWCLYGNEMHRGEKYRGLPIISMPSSKKLNQGDSCQVEVEIRMLDDEMNKIIFRRNLTFLKSEKVNPIPDPLANSADGSKFEIIRQIKKEMEVIKSPAYVLNKLIPENLEEYFFFDGERLNDYFKETPGETIREEVFKISQIDLLEKTLKHLNYKRTEFLKEGKLDSQAEEINGRLIFLRDNLEKYKNDLRKKEHDKEDAERTEKEFSDKLRTSSVSTIKKLQTERDNAEIDLEEIEIDLEKNETEKFDSLIRFAPLIFAYNQVIQISEMIARREEAGDIPPDYKRNFIDKLLHKGKCICGTDISIDNDFRRNVERLLDQCNRVSDISDELIREEVSLKSIVDEVKSFESKITSFNNKIKKLEKEKRDLTERLNEISEEIKKCGDIEKIGFYENKRNEFAQIKNKLIEEIGRQKADIERAERGLEKLESELEEELKKEKKYEKLIKTLAFCDQCLKGIEKIKNEIMEEIRRELEEKTKKQFFDLIWKKENYIDVKINEEYGMSVIHQSGEEGIDTLSAGERQVLALSFMAALNSLSGFDIPIIIDTPLGRLSKEPKKNIANNLPNYLKGKQVILLVTEEEYTEDVRDRLIERIGKEYRIDFRESKDGGIAKVVPYE